MSDASSVASNLTSASGVGTAHACKKLEVGSKVGGKKNVGISEGTSEGSADGVDEGIDDGDEEGNDDGDKVKFPNVRVCDDEVKLDEGANVCARRRLLE
jgi:hypothetical protein